MQCSLLDRLGVLKERGRILSLSSMAFNSRLALTHEYRNKHKEDETKRLNSTQLNSTELNSTEFNSTRLSSALLGSTCCCCCRLRRRRHRRRPVRGIGLPRGKEKEKERKKIKKEGCPFQSTCGSSFTPRPFGNYTTKLRELSKTLPTECARERERMSLQL
ncbi:hypothetical protein M0802_005055 [Mischocyttarus mexicanus]|nr:hypothetical protein M0802_005055 [Mischocyttarus mexicanus]